MDAGEEEVYGFILEQIDTVPHLEALLQLWHSRPRSWSESEIAERLFVNASGAREIMADLVRWGLVRSERRVDGANSYSYCSSQQTDRLLEGVVRAYRTDLIRISTAIHSKVSPGVREFARAFQFKRKGGKKS